jgi:hypothetical protein
MKVGIYFALHHDSGIAKALDGFILRRVTVQVVLARFHMYSFHVQALRKERSDRGRDDGRAFKDSKA